MQLSCIKKRRDDNVQVGVYMRYEKDEMEDVLESLQARGDCRKLKGATEASPTRRANGDFRLKLGLTQRS